MREIIRRIKPGERIILFLDYDGSLVPIKKSPELAVLHPGRRRLLERLSERTVVGIVSGRSLADIRALVGIKGIAYIGNHGLEILYGRHRWVHPGAKRTKPILGKALANLGRRIGRLPGVVIENKGVTGTVHFRRSRAGLGPMIRKAVEDEVRLKGRDLIVTEGKKVFEIRPRVRWDKGKGVRELSRWFPRQRTGVRVYIGDDQTDEDAFRALGRKAVTIHVGRSGSTQARYRLAGVGQVWKLLDGLLQLIAV